MMKKSKPTQQPSLSPLPMHATRIASGRASMNDIKLKLANVRLAFLQEETRIVTQLQEVEQSVLAVVRDAASAIGIDLATEKQVVWDWASLSFKRSP